MRISALAAVISVVMVLLLAPAGTLAVDDGVLEVRQVSRVMSRLTDQARPIEIQGRALGGYPRQTLGATLTGPDAGAFFIEDTDAFDGGAGTTGWGTLGHVWFIPTKLGDHHATLTIGHARFDEADPAPPMEISIDIVGEGVISRSGLTGDITVDRTSAPRGIPIHGQVVFTNVASEQITIVDISREWQGTGRLGISLKTGGCMSDPVLDPAETCTITFVAHDGTVGLHHVIFQVEVNEPFITHAEWLELTVTSSRKAPDNESPTEPVFTRPVVKSITFASSPVVTLRQSFSATDNRGVAGFRIARRGSDPHDWKTILDESPPYSDDPRPTTSVLVPLRVGMGLWFSGYAWDEARNMSSQGGTDEIRYSLVDLTTSMGRSGRWSPKKTPGDAYRGAILLTDGTGSVIETTVSGSAVSILGQRSSEARKGSIIVYVDGRRRGTFSMAHSRRRPDVSVIGTVSLAGSGSHRVRIVSSGRASDRIALDSLLILR